MTIGERIKNLRISCNMSQPELAAALHTSKQAIYKYENGIVSNIPSDKIETMSVIFGCSPAYLMGWEDAPAAGAAGSGSNGASAPAAGSGSGAAAASPSSSADPAVSDPRHDRLLSAYQSLNADGKEKVVEYAEDLAQNPNYVLKNVSVRVS